MFSKKKLFMKIELPNIYSLYLSLLVEYQMCITIFIFSNIGYKKDTKCVFKFKIQQQSKYYVFIFKIQQQ